MIRPLGDRVVVRVIDDVPEETVSGIYIPQNSREKPQRGTVLAAGPGLNYPLTGGDVVQVPLGITEGDTILFSKYAGTEVRVGDEELLIMREGDVLGIETEDAA